METPSSSIVGDSCQYTPIYFVEDPNITQARSYVVAQNDSNIQKPVSDTLKKFYENSGKLENNLVNRTENDFKPRILKKQDNKSGSNLKLVSFLLPKRDMKTVPCKQIIPQTNNVLLKPVYIANTPNITMPVGSSTPKVDVNSKIVVPNGTKSPSNGKVLPKKKPNEIQPNSKHTSVQLLKLGETYHSLNQLSEQQMKIVNHALKIFSNPQNTPQQPTYDPVTNTKFIYKVVSPKDLTVVGKNNVIFKPKKPEVKKAPLKKVEKKEIIEEVESDQDFDIPVFLENAVTRSGRKVKISKNILPETTPDKPKKKNGTITCCQCSSKFSSQYRLQRHYDHHPTHAPEYHSDLFSCLVAIIKSGPGEDHANIFLHQLEQLISKIKSCLPCLTKIDCVERKSNTVTDEIGRILGITPGEYKLNIDALNCVKDKNGYCSHNPPPPSANGTSRSLLNGNNVTCDIMGLDYEGIKSAVKYSTGNKRVEGRKQKLELSPSARKFKLDSKKEILEHQDTSQNSFQQDTTSHKMESDSARINSTVKRATLVKRIENKKQKPELSSNGVTLKLDTKVQTLEDQNTLLQNLLNPDNITCNEMDSDYTQTSPVVKWPTSKRIERKQNLELNSNAKKLKLDPKVGTDTLPDDIAATDNVTCAKSGSDCVQINSLVKWPSVSNIIESGNQRPEINPNKQTLKLDQKSNADIVPDDIEALLNGNIINTNHSIELKTAETEINNEQISGEPNFRDKEQIKPSHIQFHSTHFDIRSSPIKPSSSSFRTFQINTENMSKFKVQIIQPLQLTEFSNEVNPHTEEAIDINTSDIFNVDAKKETDQLTFELAKEWNCEEPKTLMKTDSLINEDTSDSYMKSDSIQPALLHVKDNKQSINKEVINESSLDIHLMSDPGHSMDTLNFLETLGNECISYSETDIRNNSVDFHLDLFSFNST